ncbi:hypothetical protein [Floridanema evergladense]|uniref:Uncharacterized protein n=1 Tax=Floridaenema evergladense BLCC-F167 TaxID=3153639 RepID=A0ABV4WE56_9CYAN
MSEQNLMEVRLSEPMAELLQEIQQTPEEYLPNLLQMIRLFRESVTMKSAQSNAWQKVMDEINNPDSEKKATRQKALSELLKKWEEEGDEQEQTETAEILRKALAENSISI